MSTEHHSSSTRHVTIIAEDERPSSSATISTPHDAPNRLTHHNNTPEGLKRRQKDAYDGEDIKKHIEELKREGGGSDVFLVRADEAFVSAHQRGKKPRFDGFSMRHWNDQCKARYMKNATNGKGLTDRAAASDEVLMAARLPPMTEADVRQHDDSDDLWMVVRGIVYDCTAWQRFHPGGEAIVRACGGRDATEVYDFYHKWVDCAGLMGAYAVGRLVKE